MTSPDKLASVLFSSLLEDSFPQISQIADQAYYFSSCPHWTWKRVCSFPFLFAAIHAEDCYQVSSQSFSLNNFSLFSLSFYVRFSGPHISFHCSLQGYLHLAPSVKCRVQMGQSTLAELFPMLRRGKHLAFLYVSQSYQRLLFQHLGQQLLLNLRVKQKSLAYSQSKAGTQTLCFGIPLALGGLVAESTEGSYSVPLLSFLSAQKGWQGVACQGRLPAAEISYTAVEIKNYWACLVPTTPFPWLCFALFNWSTLLCHLHVQGGT